MQINKLLNRALNKHFNNPFNRALNPLNSILNSALTLIDAGTVRVGTMRFQGLYELWSLGCKVATPVNHTLPRPLTRTLELRCYSMCKSRGADQPVERHADTRAVHSAQINGRFRISTGMPVDLRAVRSVGISVPFSRLGSIP